MKPLKKIVLNQVDILDETAMKNLFGGSAGYEVIDCETDLYGKACVKYGKCELSSTTNSDGNYVPVLGNCTFTTTGEVGGKCECK